MNLNDKLETIIVLIFLLALIQGIIVGLILIIKSKIKKPTLLLGFFILTGTLELITSILIELGTIKENPWLLYLPVEFIYLPAPLLFLYIKKVTSGIIAKKEYLYALTPGVLEFVVFFIFFLLPVEIKTDPEVEIFVIVDRIITITAPFYIFYYLFLIIKYIKKNKIKVLNYYSNIDGKVLLWAKRAVYFLISFYFFTIVTSFYNIIIGLEDFVKQSFVLVLAILNIGFVYWVGIHGLSQSVIFSLKDVELIKNVLNSKEEILLSSGMKFNEEFEKVVEIIRVKELFKASITLPDLAKKIGFSPRKLSEIIRIQTNQNFSQFINHFRIEEVKRLLKEREYEDINLLEIAYEVGFNSKTSFFSVFKKNTGMTPNDFKKNRVDRY